MKFLFEEKISLSSFPGVIIGQIFAYNNNLIISLGGPNEHIGAKSLGEPYQRKNGHYSASVNTFTRYGHRDDDLTSILARTISKALNRCTIVFGGIHIDMISTEQIEDIKKSTIQLAEKIIEKCKLPDISTQILE